MSAKHYSLGVFVGALLLLCGAKCSLTATSGGDSSCDWECNGDSSSAAVAVNQGRLIDAPVQGVRYISGSIEGITGAGGEFDYEAGAAIRFYIGDIALGQAVSGQALVTPLDLVSNATLDSPAVINIARLLLSLDAIPGDGVITIPPRMQTLAVQGNEALSASIRHLDFSDETAFINTATQLIAELTADYPFTAVLVDAETARDHLAESLARVGLTAAGSGAVP